VGHLYKDHQDGQTSILLLPPEMKRGSKKASELECSFTQMMLAMHHCISSTKFFVQMPDCLSQIIQQSLKHISGGSVDNL
jgi:hypothetical protein